MRRSSSLISPSIPPCIPHSTMTSKSPTLSRGPGGSAPEAPEAAVDPHPVFFCKMCLSEQPSEATRKLQRCSCVFCVECLQQYVQLAIMEGGGAPITCPDMTCQKPGELLDSEIAGLAFEDQAALYQRLKFERGVRLDPTKTWCPALECQAMCSFAPSSDGRPTAVSCPTCRNTFCSGCREPWQDSHSCPKNLPMVSSSRDSRSSSASSSDMSIKQCPVCGVYIQRNRGCAQMLCRNCKHTFCWYCLQSLDGDIFLRHYDKGSCKNKLGHSRALVMWNRTQVVGILVGLSIVVLVTSPLLLLASPCILCCVCKPRSEEEEETKKKKKKKGKKSGSLPNPPTS